MFYLKAFSESHGLSSHNTLGHTKTHSDWLSGSTRLVIQDHQIGLDPVDPYYVNDRYPTLPVWASALQFEGVSSTGIYKFYVESEKSALELNPQPVSILFRRSRTMSVLAGPMIFQMPVGTVFVHVSSIVR